MKETSKLRLLWDKFVKFTIYGGLTVFVICYMIVLGVLTLIAWIASYFIKDQK